MKSKYPSKLFAQEVKAALDARIVLEVEIASGWRARALAKEIKFWAATSNGTRADGEPAKSPSFIVNLLNLKLVAFHWFALSAQYEMLGIVSGDEVTLKYIPHDGHGSAKTITNACNRKGELPQ